MCKKGRIIIKIHHCFQCDIQMLKDKPILLTYAKLIYQNYLQSTFNYTEIQEIIALATQCFFTKVYAQKKQCLL